LPGLSPFLSRRSPDTISQQARRARLLCNRSYTATTRARFAKPDAAPVDPTCKNPQCAAAGLADTVHHMLLECPSHATARSILAAALRGLAQPATLTLSLATILCSSPPPTPFPSADTALASIHHSNAFLDRVCATRNKEGFHPLDNQPTSPPNPG
jgi:hypothetical protein